MADIRLKENLSLAGTLMDWFLRRDGVLDEGRELQTAALVALGTDRVALPEAHEVLPDPDSTDRRGWWGDWQAEEIWNGWPIGTKAWLLLRSKIMDVQSEEGSTVERARLYTLEALQPLIDRRVASGLNVTAARVGIDRIDVHATIFRGPLPEISLRFQMLWDNIRETAMAPDEPLVIKKPHFYPIAILKGDSGIALNAGIVLTGSSARFSAGSGLDSFAVCRTFGTARAIADSSLGVLAPYVSITKYGTAPMVGMVSSLSASMFNKVSSDVITLPVSSSISAYLAQRWRTNTARFVADFEISAILTGITKWQSSAEFDGEGDLDIDDSLIATSMRATARLTTTSSFTSRATRDMRATAKLAASSALTGNATLPALDITFTDHQEWSTTADSYTLSNADIGAPSETRYVIAAVYGGGANSDITSVTIGGSAATQIAYFNPGSGATTRIGFYGRLVTSGTTANIVLNKSGSGRAAIGVYRAIYVNPVATSVNPNGTGSTSPPWSDTIDVVVGGALLGFDVGAEASSALWVSHGVVLLPSGASGRSIGASISSSTGITWTGLTEAIDANLGGAFQAQHYGLVIAMQSA